ncbi:MAG: UDP-glucose/GDP-mannose dehydrogenase family protein [Methanocellales archaeon]|nr:UDP-glucose/GDP-mannose dehydrogenase family protein [Methanocellales archaeon]MDD3291886.1 UDP-glucose/GDP-mannose dehydrogenase family protein [Methanocellales archaeon]MDD5235529.1 UDP-glucose/GDP-mannose dehydrogenase family protein [Methanocellales archaeon]MDD5485148.1 UDP-glucose/GDP-mannose dehydrogenase family protein [Methanocellales archaeon]
MKRISVIGMGFVGLVSAACFAHKGFDVIASTHDPKKVELIKEGKAPFYEKDLTPILVGAVKKGNLRVMVGRKEAILDSDITFIAVGTPSKADGSIDLGFIKSSAKEIGEALKDKDGHLVVVKSTVAPGTTEEIVKPVIEKHSGKKIGSDFGLCMSPEFLREGNAVYDTLHPDRIVIGESDKSAGDALEEFYREFYGEKCSPILRMSLVAAEMVKYASNALLSTKISFANEIGNICKEFGIDAYEVMRAVGMDHRLSPHFLRAGVGFGGSCFPKDVKALIHKAKDIGYDPKLLKAVMNVNEEQPKRMIKLLERKLPSLKGKKVAVLGLAFKNDTDDIRESRAIPIIKMLMDKNVRVSVYDPLANENMRSIFPDPDIEYCTSAEESLRNADACLVVTEWDEFKKLDHEFDVMKNRIIIDGRKVISPREGIDYEGLCW